MPFRMLAAEGFDAVLAEAGLSRADLAYVATTGDGESLAFTTGHFYSMTTHARGATYLDPSTRLVLDVGALHGRAIRTDARVRSLTVADDRVTGVTLPFVSYGGSSIIASFMCAGLLLNIGQNRPMVIARESFEFD